MNGIYHLKGTIKHYDWGGFFFIPALLQLDNPNHTPFAEYWLGTHPNDNCLVELPAGAARLNDHMANDPSLLGKSVKKKFGQLPYLLKILDVRDMLSIQVHPTREAAEKEFARENSEGIPIDSPRRNYKDANHKPELMVALGEFWLLHGFKPKGHLIEILNQVKEFKSLLPVFEKKGYQGLYKTVMEMPQADVNALLRPLLDRIVPLYRDKRLNKSGEDYWAAKAALTFNQGNQIDRGIFSVYFFNLLRLEKGQGIFQDAGVPHAYLEGQNVEIMASSDNVLRGGLTTKHIDVTELMKHVRCESGKVEILSGETLTGNERVYQTPAPDFRLSVYSSDHSADFTFDPATAEIILLVEGMAALSDGDRSIELKPGMPSAIVFPGKRIHINVPDQATIFRASVPQP